MDDLLSEKEQIEQIRGWWSEYGNYVVGGVVLGALSLFGWNYFKDSSLEEQYQASSLYGELTDEVAGGNLDEAEVFYGRIVADHDGSAYASQARLAMARLYMDQNRDEDAANVLRELLASAAGDEFRQVARLRLAKVLLYQDQPGEAIELLDAAGEDEAFSARYDEVRGDAYVALEQIENARAAYQRALAEAGQSATINQEFVQLKLLDLPFDDGVAVPAAAEGAAEGADGTDSQTGSAVDAGEPAEEDAG